MTPSAGPLPDPAAGGTTRVTAEVGTTLVDVLRRRFVDEPGRPAFVFLEDGEREAIRLTGGEIDRRARAVARMLQAEGATGERALLLYPSGPDFVIAYLGCLYAGVTPVASHPPARHRADHRLSRIAADAGAGWALTADRVLAGLDRQSATAPLLAGLRWRSTSDAAEAAAGAWRPPAIGPETLALLQYTSGSTSEPRGVMVTHRNLLDNLADLDVGFEHGPDSVMVTWLPIFHDMGLIYGLLQPLTRGFLCVMMQPAAFLQGPVRWLRAITRYRGTHAAAPNFAYDLCVRRIPPGERGGLDLRSWRVALNAAEPIRADTLDRFEAAFAPHGFDRRAFAPGFGLAEATLKVTTSPVGEPPIVLHVDAADLARHRVSIRPAGGDARETAPIVGCGKPVPETALAIVDPETGEPCPPDRIGEVWVGGRLLARGYWRNERATGDVFRARLAGSGAGPFLRTGDLGFLHGGELFITGRAKDLIIVHGLNYYPQDIERTVEASHPALSTAGSAAFALDADGAERLVIAAEVERIHVRTLDPAEVVAAIRRAVFEEHGLAVWGIALLRPRTLPKTSSGKVRRGACRAAFVAGTLETVAAWSAGTPAAAEASPASAPGRAEAEIREWLVQRFAERLSVAPISIDPHASLALHGMDSVDAVGLTGEMQQWLGRPLAPGLVYDYPSIAALARYLAAGDAVTEPAAEAAGTRSTAVAVVGLGCRVPGARDPAELWRLLRDGIDAVTEVPASRWYAARFHDPDPDARDTMISRAGGFVEDVDRFDPAFFRISPREAERMDPQQRLLLEVGWEALEDAGIAADGLAGSRTGVFVGISNSDYARLLLAGPDVGDLYVGTGSALSIAANRLSYLLDLRGPSLAVDTACSSSLVALALACQSLRRGECDLALAGGVNLVLSPEYTIAFSKANMMSPTGRCRTFDASADGYVRGEGAGVVVLKRLDDAERDGDRILAVVRGVAVNQDGRTAGLTAPNGPAQRAVIRAALRDAGIAPARVGYVEAHGTGTPLGDPIEVNALKAVLLDGRAAGATCWIGSVKTNIGHLESAAGIAGFIKAVQALVHREIPPSLHCRRPNPALEIEGTALRIATRREPWPAAEGPRVAGVSSFGFGGTNAHAVLEEYVPAAAAPASPPRPAAVLALSAHDREALVDLAHRYVAHLDRAPAEAWAEVCATASVGRTAMAERLALVAGSMPEARESLAAWAHGAELDPGRGREGRVEAGASPKVAFLFTGQGSQHPRMGEELYRTEPVFRAAIDRCSEILGDELGPSLVDRLYGPAAAPLDDMRVTQPALFSLQYALTRLWAAFGVVPAAVIGHSVGEYAAACAADALSLEDALRLVAARGRLFQSLPADGAMVSAMASLAVIEAAIAPFADELAVAAVNGPASVVFSGRRAAARAVAERLAASGVVCTTLAISHASHSPLVEPVLDAFTAEASRATPAAPGIPLVSNVTGTWMAGAPDAAYWRRHLRQTVRFSEGVGTLLAAGHDVFLEIGPYPTLCAIGEQMLPDEKSRAWIPSLHRERPALRQMLAAVASLWTRGARVDWAAVQDAAARRRVALPTYPFRRIRCWVAPVVSRPAAGGHPLAGRRVHRATAGDEILFESRLSAAAPAYLGEHRLFGAAVLPTAAYLEMARAALGRPEEPWVTEDVALIRPLRLAEAEERIVQTALAPEGPDGWSWRIFSRSTDDTRVEWSLHATGRWRHAAPAAVPDLHVDPPEEDVDAGAFYDGLARRGIELGPSYRLLSSIRRGEGTATATVRVPAIDEAPAALGLHPALLEGALLVAAATLPASGAYVQTAIERVRIVSPPGRALHARARRRPGSDGAALVDVRLTGEDGRAVAEIEGLAFRPASREMLAAASPDLYRLQWVESRPAPSPATPARRSWLILADEGGTGRALADLVEGRGDACVLARGGDAYGVEPDGSIRARPGERADHDRLLADAALRLGGAPDVVAHLWSLDTGTDLSSPALRAAVTRGPASAIALLQAIGARAGSASRLWLVTRRAQPVEGAPTDAGLLQSPLWGFGKAAALEHPERWGGLVDLDAEPSDLCARRLADEIARAHEREDHVAFRGDRRFVARIVRAPALASRATRLAPDATYLISGGLGSLGLSLAAAMVEAGARHLVLVSRSGPSTEARRAAIRALESAGAVVLAPAVDVRALDAVARLIADVRASLPPLRGIVHAAGTPGACPLDGLDREAIDEVLGAKVEGALALGRATAGLPLDFFACVSSMVAAWGAGGQAHYAAANHVLDVLAHRDRGAGRPTVSIGLGPVRGGMLPEATAAIMERMGVTTWETDRAAAVVLRLLHDDRAHLVAAEIDWSRFRAVLEGRGRRPMLERVGGGVAPGGRVSPPVPGGPRESARGLLAEQLGRAPAGERRRLAAEAVVREASHVLGMDPAQWPDLRRGFFDLGMNSLIALELRRRLEVALGRSLPATLVFDQPNVEAVAAFVDRLVPGADRPAAPAEERAPATEAAAAASSGDALSEKLARLEALVERNGR